MGEGKGKMFAFREKPDQRSWMPNVIESEDEKVESCCTSEDWAQGLYI